ncbi:hypothetical protein N0V85_009774, partial [Neurospora sp. IMI 360204]
ASTFYGARGGRGGGGNGGSGSYHQQCYWCGGNGHYVYECDEKEIDCQYGIATYKPADKNRSVKAVVFKGTQCNFDDRLPNDLYVNASQKGAVGPLVRSLMAMSPDHPDYNKFLKWELDVVKGGKASNPGFTPHFDLLPNGAKMRWEQIKVNNAAPTRAKSAASTNVVQTGAFDHLYNKSAEDRSRVAQTYTFKVKKGKKEQDVLSRIVELSGSDSESEVEIKPLEQAAVVAAGELKRPRTEDGPLPGSTTVPPYAPIPVEQTTIKPSATQKPKAVTKETGADQPPAKDPKIRDDLAELKDQYPMAAKFMNAKVTVTVEDIVRHSPVNAHAIHNWVEQLSGVPYDRANEPKPVYEYYGSATKDNSKEANKFVPLGTKATAQTTAMSLTRASPLTHAATNLVTN